MPLKRVHKEKTKKDNNVKNDSVINITLKKNNIKQSEIKLKKNNTNKHKKVINKKNISRQILVKEFITVKNLADKLNINKEQVMDKLNLIKITKDYDYKLQIDIIMIIANEFEYDVKYSSQKNKLILKKKISLLKRRPPVVTIMGHVDHGKTSLLDKIRKSNIVKKEYGEITQHIGAYNVKLTNGEYITFLDTPGHEAFISMRYTSAKITDLIVLVISATEGIKKQTVEAINHAKNYNVPIIVALNKIDLSSSDTDKVLNELSKHGILCEQWGGDTIVVNISAKKNINIDLLIEMILLRTEIMELKANYDKNPEGVVIEANLDTRMGPVATLLIQNGSLKLGDNLVIGTTYAKIKAMFDEYGKRIKIATPSTAIKILGINEVPRVGDKFILVINEVKAREIVRERKDKSKTLQSLSSSPVFNINYMKDSKKNFFLILKTDTQGTLDALCNDIKKSIKVKNINFKIILKGVGPITKSDVNLALVSNALIFGFNIILDSNINKLAKSQNVKINVYRILSDITEYLKKILYELDTLQNHNNEKIVGKAIVKQIFKLPNSKTVLGCSIIMGKISKNLKVRIIRKNNKIIFEGNILSLKIFKNDVQEVTGKDHEFGIIIKNFSDMQLGDIIETFVL
ncbi:MAG: translation initiation factor IF-2 [Endomicrobium sp.]|jgi:translation initiation factor IF-2|nr:translation initiation factor IF-2 [Endomicrobium sp.]